MVSLAEKAPGEMAPSKPPAGKRMPAWLLPLAWYALITIVVFGAALIGIWTRPAGLLASFWPANALLLGLLVQKPDLARWPGWLIAGAAYIAADMATGSHAETALWLTIANLAGVATAFVMLRRLPEADRRLTRALSVIYLFAVLLAASAVSALFASVKTTALLHTDYLTGTSYWFAAELVSYIAILPVMLADQRIALRVSVPRRRGDTRKLMTLAAPLVALAVSMAIAMLVRGPGMPGFIAPAVLWCALTYSVWSTAVVTLLAFAWTLTCFYLGLLDIAFQADSPHALVSLRLGIALLTLGPLTVASVNAARNDAIARVDFAANHDMLTGVLLRRPFLERAERALDEAARRKLGFAAIAIDVDNLARVNDTHGHAAGDDVLAQVAGLVSGCIRRDDLIGRIAGQQFALVVAGLSKADALALAERLRKTVAHAAVMAHGRQIPLTVTAGVAHVAANPAHTAIGLIRTASAAVAQGKSNGGNAVTLAV